jgi:hypothetical protein
MLSRPAPKPLLYGFLAGGWLVSVAAGLVIVFVLEGAVSTSDRRSASPTVDLVGGLLTLGLAGLLWRRGRRSRPGAQAATALAADEPPGAQRNSLASRMLSRGSPKSAFALGMILNLPGIWYLVALKDIANGGYGVLAAVSLIVVFNAIMFVLAEVPLIGYLVRPARTRSQVQRFQAWLARNGRMVAVGAAALVGVYLIIRAIVGYA